MKVAQATCGQNLANQVSVFPVDVDQLPKDGVIRVMACLCNAILSTAHSVANFIYR